MIIKIKSSFNTDKKTNLAGRSFISSSTMYPPPSSLTISGSAISDFIEILGVGGPVVPIGGLTAAGAFE